MNKNLNEDYIITGGAIALASSNKFNSKIIKAHSFDYDFYVNGNNNYKHNDSIVFLDTLQGYGPDTVFLKTKSKVTLINYLNM